MNINKVLKEHSEKVYYTNEKFPGEKYRVHFGTLQWYNKKNKKYENCILCTNLLEATWEYYKEKKVPWDKVPIDTKIEVYHTVLREWIKRYHAGDKKVFNYGASSWSCDSKHNTSSYGKIRLAEEITIDNIVYPIGSE